MLNQELSASMERLILSIIVLGGSFAIIVVALLTHSDYFSTVVPVAATLMGNVTAYWLLGNQQAQTAKQMASAQSQAVEQVGTQTATANHVDPNALKAALVDLLKEQSK